MQTTADQQYDRFRRECYERGNNWGLFFDRLIEEGNNPGFAAMLAMQEPAGTKGTDRAFLQGSHHWADSLHPMNRKYMFEAAKKAGIDTTGKVYKGGLGRPNNPLAWVSDTSDVLRACRLQNLTCNGVVNHKAEKMPPPPPKPLADDLVDEFVEKYTTRDPDLAAKIKEKPKKLVELKEQIVEKHSRKK